LARIHHRLKLTKEAGLEVPRLEVLLQKTKRLDEKSDHCIFLGPFIPSIQKNVYGSRVPQWSRDRIFIYTLW